MAGDDVLISSLLSQIVNGEPLGRETVKALWRLVSGQACPGLLIQTCPEKHMQVGIVVMDQML